MIIRVVWGTGVKHSPADAASIPIPAERRASGSLADYLALTKPRLNFLVVATSAAGLLPGGPSRPDLVSMAQAVAGTALVAGGAAVLNQVYERDTDALMRRTRLRPLPDGRVSPADARAFGLALSIAGLRPARGARQLAVRRARARHARHLPRGLHADEAADIALDAGRRGPRGAAGADRLDGGARQHRPRRRARSSRSCSSGRFRTSWRSRWLYRDDYGKAGFPDAAR